MKLAPLIALAMCVGLIGCSEVEPEQRPPTNLKAIWTNPNKDADTRAVAYAAWVTEPGLEEACPLAPGQVGKTGTYRQTFICLNKAAYAGCFSALTGDKWNEAEWRREYPEKLMLDQARTAFKQCAAA
jgi:hypothetical protein